VSALVRGAFLQGRQITRPAWGARPAHEEGHPTDAAAHDHIGRGEGVADDVRAAIQGILDDLGNPAELLLRLLDDLRFPVLFRGKTSDWTVSVSKTGSSVAGTYTSQR